MPMTKKQFEALEPAHQLALSQFASRFDFNVLHLNPTDVAPPEPAQPPHWAQQQAIANEIKSERQRANPIRHPLPTAAEAKALAARLGLNPAHIRTQEDAAAEAQQADIDAQFVRIAELTEAKAGAKLVSEFGDHSNPDLRAAARAAVAEVWPSFVENIGWKD